MGWTDGERETKGLATSLPTTGSSWVPLNSGHPLHQARTRSHTGSQRVKVPSSRGLASGNTGNTQKWK